ncbi:hypothetical protein SAMN02745248_02271 [Hathewaya proteolytica DSM 3090]|uniref:FAD-dependent protein C-terminal domain-containing protein n=1 Tax=Hathewaya proteolytica DSM 3090 TaxID=1121331 RepID=A0A1M6RFK6_9CLOT|nr:NAD(P)/FAD-dependent oxidoreductase [Hathewaya proteolytica]SHK31158.1 hypothetical protein SAMN02745248_02271 [Hathewaya proteolytica DSM 3090]
MSIQVNNITLSIDEPMEKLKSKVAHTLKINENDIINLSIIKESIDARKKDNIRFNYQVAIEVNGNEKTIVKGRNSNEVSIREKAYAPEFKMGDKILENRPVIVGMGPAGMFAGLILAKQGYKPLILERGEKVEERSKTVKEFWSTGKLNSESNVQFGEGGAGTFSDGKLTTRSKDYRCDYILEQFVKAGAREEIKYMGKPHVGTDILKIVVKNIREEIISLGGEIRFNSKLEDIVTRNEKLCAIVANGQKIPCEVAVLATGHSARDTYEMLHKRGIFISAKPFAIGVRVEHPQELINKNQYGKFYNHPRLKAADYKLTYTDEVNGRGVYSFCMCPGGVVVASSSEQGMLVTNGMSYSKRDMENANSALVVTVSEKDFEGKGPLSGIEFQRHYERLAYECGGGDHVAPVQLVGDFLKDKNSKSLAGVNASFTRGYVFNEIKKCLPSYVVDSLKRGILNFDRKIKGFAMDGAIITGIESRTSAPVRIDRNENLESISLSGLYVAGEGAGFAGGIISAAVDGIKVAERIIEAFKIRE